MVTKYSQNQSYVLSIDQGTTSSRSIIFDSKFKIIDASQKEFKQIFPKSGWVEHDAKEILDTVIRTSKSVLSSANIKASEVATIGITNQRETVVIWDRKSGEPIYNAIVWQDRRTTEICNKLKGEDFEPIISEKTGLTLDPYFSATKIAWILDNVSNARKRAEKGLLAFGTIDTWLLWNLSVEKSHLTDATNASRTMLFDITKGEWDSDLLDLFNIPKSILPRVVDSAFEYGTTKFLGAKVRINGVAGDQQAAALGQACFSKGMIKSTFGTGCFVLLNTGTQPVFSKNQLLTTIASQICGKKKYALEGSIFNAGTVVQWLRDSLNLIKTASDSDFLAEQAKNNHDVVFIPAFTGLGAPHWDPEARGAIFGITRDTSNSDIMAAALESVCFQTNDLLEAMKSDWKNDQNLILRVDGGMTDSHWTMQSLANIIDASVECSSIKETTALGAAWLAGNHASIWPGEAEFAEHWSPSFRFETNISDSFRNEKISTWNRYIKKLVQ